MFHMQYQFASRQILCRAQHTKSANKARSRKRARNDDNAEGPPDKHSDFKKGKYSTVNYEYFICKFLLLYT